MISIQELNRSVNPTDSSVVLIGLRRDEIAVSLPHSRVATSDVVTTRKGTRNIFERIPAGILLAKDDKHQDPDDHPFNGYSNEDKEQDRQAHEDYGWLREQMENRQREREDRDNN